MGIDRMKLFAGDPAKPTVGHSILRWLRTRSLVLKLTLAFLCVGLLGALLVAFFVGQRTQEAFSQFINDRDQLTMMTELTRYYQTYHTWAGVGTVVQMAQLAETTNGSHPMQVTLALPDGQVIIGDGHFHDVTVVSSNILARATPITVEGNIVGLLISDGSARQHNVGTAEGDFLQRFTQALLYGAIGATITALLLGILLARTLTRPLRELTVAIEALAQGALGQQVVVRSHDELGALARSFNHMSTDLARSSSLRRQMTADIAHDLRTPLSVILGYTEALREGKLPPDQDTFETMHTEAQHLQHLIDDLRTLSLADAGELPLQFQEIAPQVLIERAAAAVVAAAQQRGIALVVNIMPNLPALRVDPRRMAQVFGNLLHNALQYTPRGGLIRVQAEAHAEQVHLRVEDTGAGIAAEDLPHVFERFYRVDTSRLQDGSSGLGLAIVKSIVEAHHGTITVASVLDRGTTFTIALPTHIDKTDERWFDYDLCEQSHITSNVSSG